MPKPVLMSASVASLSGNAFAIVTQTHTRIVRVFVLQKATQAVRQLSQTHEHYRVEHVTNKLQRADSCTLPTPYHIPQPPLVHRTTRPRP